MRYRKNLLRTSRRLADEKVQVNFHLPFLDVFHEAGNSTFSVASTAPQHDSFAMLEEIVLYGYCWKRGEIPKRWIISVFFFFWMTCNCTTLHSCIPPLSTCHGFSLALASTFISSAYALSRTLQTWSFPPCSLYSVYIL